MQRLALHSFRGHSGPNETDADVELGLNSLKKSEKMSCDAPVDALHTLKKLCGLDSVTLCKYPGIEAYVRYLEASFNALLKQKHNQVWEALGCQHPVTTKDCWELFEVVASVLDKLWTGKIDDISNEVIRHYSESSLASPADSNPVRRRMAPKVAGEVVSSVLLPIVGWMTMITSPVQKLDNENVPGADYMRFSVTNEGMFVCSKGTAFDRPITFVLKRFHQNFAVPIWKTRTRSAGLASISQEVTLDVSCINLATLQDIAKIQIVWVNDIQSHLAFDKGQRRLCIFRFPSFCVVSALESSRPVTAPILDALVSGSEPDECGDAADDRLAGHRRLHQEMLMSYRMIFGQEYGSRKRARLLLEKLKAGAHGSVGEETPAVQYDTMLDALCTVSHKDRKITSLPPGLWPPNFRSTKEELQEQSWYNAEEFPVFGQRLESLQEFVLRQRPSRLTDMWRDKRNMLQWYTFWAVLIFGGFSILIGLLQLVVSVAQLVASYQV